MTNCRQFIKKWAAVGRNMIIIRVEDLIRYDCHPGISVRNVWSHEKVKSDFAKCHFVPIIIRKQLPRLVMRKKIILDVFGNEPLNP